MLTLPPGAGRAGEAAAEAHLRSRGRTVLARNYRTSQGEIDIVALDGGTYVFAEVKTRRSRTLGLPEEGMTVTKSRRIAAAAQAYLEQHGLEDRDWRVDLVAVELDSAGRPLRVEVFENAVEG
jgi:putative endonuclease